MFARSPPLPVRRSVVSVVATGYQAIRIRHPCATLRPPGILDHWEIVRRTGRSISSHPQAPRVPRQLEFADTWNPRSAEAYSRYRTPTTPASNAAVPAMARQLDGPPCALRPSRSTLARAVSSIAVNRLTRTGRADWRGLRNLLTSRRVPEMLRLVARRLCHSPMAPAAARGLSLAVPGIGDPILQTYDPPMQGRFWLPAHHCRPPSGEA